MWTSDPVRGGQRPFFSHLFVFFLVPHSFPIHSEMAQLILFFFYNKFNGKVEPFKLFCLSKKNCIGISQSVVQLLW